MSEPKEAAIRSNADQPSAATGEAIPWEYLHPEEIVLVEHLSAEDEDARLRAEADLKDWGLPPIWLEAGV